jgi:hypothetical protein
MTTKLTTSNLSADTLATISGPRISNVKIADSSYTILDDTAANISGGFIVINGQNFISNCQVLIDNTPATSVTFVSNSVIRAQVPASAEGTTKSIYIINPDGSSAIIINGLTYSAFPAWSTNSTLTSFEALVPVSIQLSAPSATVYTLAAANTLPSSLSLYANGLIAGTVAANTTTNYNFTVNAKDAENQDTNRNFTLPITRNVEPAWTTAADLGTALTGVNISSTLVATDLSNVTYSVAAGSSLPSSLTLAANGLLSGSVSAANTYSFGVVATDTANLSNTRTFSISITAPDQYSIYNTLFLNGEGTASTNGANNSVFIDSSTNNFSMQRYGNTNQGIFSPYSVTGWSNYFSSASLNVPNSAALDLGSGAYTVEGWFNTNTTAGQQTIISFLTGFKLTVIPASSFLRVWGDAGTTYQSATATIIPGTWYHFAWVRSSTSLGKLYLDGVLILTVTSSNIVSSTPTGQNVLIGTFGDGFSNNFFGYISNLRVLKGTALYTSAFTPPTTPLTAIANTSLLTCQSNRFVDNSTINAALTINGGTPSVQAFSPFLTPTSYSPSLHGGSAYFDGTGDYLSIPDNAAFDFGTADYTVEGWMYFTSVTTNRYQMFYHHAVDASWTSGVTLATDNNTFGFWWGNAMVITTTVLPNVWYHVALTRVGNLHTLYINGVSVGTYSVSHTYAPTNNVGIGAQASGTYYFMGYISNVRVIKGTAIYTSTFTPPTAPLTAIANTSLLANFTNAGIIDQSGKNNLETVGDAKVSTAVKKYGSSSMSFDGTGDYLKIPYSPSFNFGTGNFTIEGWVYLNSLSASYYVVAGTFTTGTTDEWLFQIQNNGNIRFLTIGSDDGEGATFRSASITTSTWYHLAAVRSATTITLYVNGTSVGSYINSNSIGSASKVLYIGIQNAGSWPLDGYIDDLRITRGYARYTGNFTPPVAIT